MPLSLLLPFVIAAQVTPQAPRLTPEALRQVDSIAGAEFAKDSLGSLTIAGRAFRKLRATLSSGR